MLSNAYFLAKFRFDPAENEPAKKLRILKNHYGATFAEVPLNALVAELAEEREPQNRKARSSAAQWYSNLNF